jgi:SOS response regulatory protein OraA/RecX
MVATLVDRKWTPEAARRLERRWRLLPPDEQLARLNRLLVRRGYDPLPTGDA